MLGLVPLPSERKKDPGEDQRDREAVRESETEREGEGERTRVTVEFNSRMFRGYGAVNLGDSIQELDQLSTVRRRGGREGKRVTRAMVLVAFLPMVAPL